MNSGYKAIKTGLSVLLCLLIAKLFKLHYPFFVVLPAVMPISYSAQETVKAGVNRAVGTIIGAAVGVCLALFQPKNPVLSAIGIIIIIYFCDLIKWKNSAAIAGIVFISIMDGIRNENPVAYSFNRVTDTFIGIIVNILVNNIIFYVDLAKVTEKKCTHAVELLSAYVKDSILTGKGLHLDSIQQELDKIKKHQNSYAEEFVFRSSSKRKLDRADAIVKALEATVIHISMIHDLYNGTSYHINSENLGKFNQLFNCTPADGFSINKENDVVFNYHLGIVLDDLMKLRCL